MKLRMALVVAIGMLSASMALAAEIDDRPNIVLILADDLGYGDVGSYGATKVKTPHIDRIAREGIRFADAHTPAAHCKPTRYGVLTGSYHWRLQERWYTWVRSNSEELLVDTERTTLASLLKSAGYATAYVGKWHLGFGVGKVDWNKALKP